ncbi:hypothetical protein [Amycolatopsis sp. GM8]|uniref:hypothetical protein n=1 Tax=Amycolatopsis sp. GM8 TaxID=2896530 RepID=UPI001F1BEFBA|nr:hypothetical protein [Amycolatopsis sp. GM8]
MDKPQMPECERRAHAVRTVAASARDAEDLVELLDMLGLKATDIRPQPPKVPVQRGKCLSIDELHALVQATARS